MTTETQYRISPIRPTGRFSRLIWRFVRYEYEPSNDVLMVLKPNPDLHVVMCTRCGLTFRKTSTSDSVVIQ
jgi:hypothetical protein